MADIDLSSETKDTTFDGSGVAFGADSQGAATPSVWDWAVVWAYYKTLANTWSAKQTFTGGAEFSEAPTITGSGGVYIAGGADVAIADGGTGAGTEAGARTALGLNIGTDVQAHSAVLDATTASFETADQSKLDGIEASATADQTGSEIKTAYEAEADTNAYDDAAVTKLAGLEAGADVTNATNVAAAGALMDSEVSSLSGVKTLTVPDSTTVSSFAKTLLDDADAASARSTLGVGSGSGDMIASTYDAASVSEQLAGLTATQTLTNKTLTSPVIAAITNTGTITLPTSTDTLIGRATTDTLTNKTFESPVINTGLSGTAIKDEDDMSSDSATHLATQQSIKKYVDDNANSAVVLLGTVTASSSATVEFVLSSGYFKYEVIFYGVSPATDGQHLILRTSSDGGSSYDSGATDYAYGLSYQSAASGDIFDGDESYIQVVNSVGNGANENADGALQIWNPSGALYTKVNFQNTLMNLTPSYVSVAGGGIRLSAADVDAIQLSFVSGNIATGTFKLYGWSST